MTSIFPMPRLSSRRMWSVPGCMQKTPSARRTRALTGCACRLASTPWHPRSRRRSPWNRWASLRKISRFPDQFQSGISHTFLVNHGKRSMIWGIWMRNNVYVELGGSVFACVARWLRTWLRWPRLWIRLWGPWTSRKSLLSWTSSRPRSRIWTSTPRWVTCVRVRTMCIYFGMCM